MLALDQLKETARVKMENLRLLKELDAVNAAHKNEKSRWDEQMNAAKLSLQKSEFLQVQDKTTFNKMRNEFEQRIEALNAENAKLKIELNGKEASKSAKNVQSDDSLHLRDLQSKLGALHKNNQINSDLIRKQNVSLMRLQNDNIQLQRRNRPVFAKENVWFPPPARDVETGIQKKINRLEDVMTKNIQMLKKEFGSTKLEVRNEKRLAIS